MLGSTALHFIDTVHDTAVCVIKNLLLVELLLPASCLDLRHVSACQDGTVDSDFLFVTRRPHDLLDDDCASYIDCTINTFPPAHSSVLDRLIILISPAHAMPQTADVVPRSWAGTPKAAVVASAPD